MAAPGQRLHSRKRKEGGHSGRHDRVHQNDIARPPPVHQHNPMTRQGKLGPRLFLNRRRTLGVVAATFALLSVSFAFLSIQWAQSLGYGQDPTILPRMEKASTFGGGIIGSGGNTRERIPTHHACDGSDGVYHIEKGDIGGAAGTIFFQFVIGQLIYAEKYNLKPWVFLNNVSYIIYDPLVHGQGPGVTFDMMSGLTPSYVERPGGHWRDAYPGKPILNSSLTQTRFHFEGTGVWEHYFEPVSDFVPGDTSCTNKPLVTMDLYLVTPGVHGFAPWAPKCWRYQYLPDYITKPHIPVQEWLEPQRHVAHDVLTKYIRFLPYLKSHAERVNPRCSMQESCLGLHIRQSDKAAGRRQIKTDEFLPYAESFLKNGGSWIYVATDSRGVVDHIRTNWPAYVRDKIRSMGDDVVRSNNSQAVFDIGSHHRTNKEIFVEILALSKCQFLVHGFSAVTETSIWINIALHPTSVNLEDVDHLSSHSFGLLVQNVLDGANATELMIERRETNWWKYSADATHESRLNPSESCSDYRGVMLIGTVGKDMPAGAAFFVSVLNQLRFAEQNNLIAWVHLGSDSELVYDPDFNSRDSSRILDDVTVVPLSSTRHPLNSSMVFPDAPLWERGARQEIQVDGDGVWENYFEPVSTYSYEVDSCRRLPFVVMGLELLTPLLSWSPASVKAWRYDDIPDALWVSSGKTFKDFMAPMRQEGSRLVAKYFRFKHHILKRAQEVNPVNPGCVPCLAVHLRNGDKSGKFRSKFPPNKFRSYMEAFLRAGGKSIYVSSDSHRTLEYIAQHFPDNVRKSIRTQGQYVVRSTKKWPLHLLDSHHRINSEVLVDILAMSKCGFLLHGHSATSEAAIYLNPTLHNRSVNWEDEKGRASVPEFEQMVKATLAKQGTVGANCSEVQASENGGLPGLAIINSPKPTPKSLHNMTVLRGSNRQCRRNAIVYLAQKRHSSYNRDSYGILMQSLERMNKNYLGLSDHADTTDVIIFHTSDFDQRDILEFESSFGGSFRKTLTFVDLADSVYWMRPSWHEFDDPTTWYAFPLFSEGYRRMMHWFAIDIWNFFEDYNRMTGCNYTHIMRFDEDSMLHSPITYDVFDFMRQNNFAYGFRLCSYEMQVTRRIWKLWTSRWKGTPEREIDLDMCGFYNNFFVADISFFQSDSVRKFLKFVDRQGMIYRRRLGDLMIHSLAVYAFAPPDRIHRFLDFTYEHTTVDHDTGCVMWGGIQEGWADPHAKESLAEFFNLKVKSKGCTVNTTALTDTDLSPTYARVKSRVPSDRRNSFALATMSAGKVELPGKGILSG